jgi:hypothetical protein
VNVSFSASVQPSTLPQQIEKSFQPNMVGWDDYERTAHPGAVSMGNILHMTQEALIAQDVDFSQQSLQQPPVFPNMILPPNPFPSELIMEGLMLSQNLID